MPSSACGSWPELKREPGKGLAGTQAVGGPSESGPASPPIEDLCLAVPDHIRQVGIGFPFVLRSDIRNRLFQRSAVGENSVDERGHRQRQLPRSHYRKVKGAACHSDLLPPFDPLGCTRYTPLFSYERDVAGLVGG
jgi:hypothetical protein